MARTFPLASGLFAGRLLVRSCVWQLQESIMSSGYGSGEPLDVELSPAVWTAEVQLGPLTQHEAVEQRALIQMHLKPGRPFRLYNRAIPGPRLDPQGVILGAATPTLHTIGTEGRSLRIGGLPSGYRLSVGDMLSIQFGASPVKVTLHQVGEDAQATGGGLTPEFDVDPPIPLGPAVGAAATLVRASALMIRVPGSYQPGSTEGSLVTGVGFRAIQTRAW